MRGGDVDDAAPVLRAHAGHGEARGVEGAGEIDGENSIPFLHWEILYRADMLNACVVDEDIHPAEFLGGESHHLLNLAGLAHVCAVVRDSRAMRVARLRNLRARSFNRCGIAKAVEYDVGALLGEFDGDTQADAAGGAGNEGGFVQKCSHQGIVAEPWLRRNPE